ncbi:hypothetical protein FBQ87_06135 [Sphingobacteriales bacterium CHB3]|nr:hypothetical protein [Sphingobacteriales bacterium CHB3]
MGLLVSRGLLSAPSVTSTNRDSVPYFVGLALPFEYISSTKSYSSGIAQMKILISTLLALHFLFMPTSCKNEIRNELKRATEKEPDTFVHYVRGKIIYLDLEKQMLTVSHQGIPDYLEATTSSFRVGHSYLFAGLEVGKEVEGNLVVSKADTWLESLNLVLLEPQGGKITDLVIFDEDTNPLISLGSYSINNLNRTTTAAKVGKYSLGAQWGYHAGLQINMLNSDTSVFWFQKNSRLQFWTRSSASGNSALNISIVPLGGTYFSLNPSFDPGSSANQWYLVDIPIPENFRDMPFVGLVIQGPGVQHTRYIDDLKITNVRLYAGPGEPPIAAIDYIAASQIGYAPNMKKQFTSPLDFQSFQIVRLSDNAVVFTGGPPVRTVKSDVVGVPPPKVYFGDFSQFKTPGRYKIVVAKKESLPFNIKDDVFDAPIVAVQRMLYYQRAFTAIEEPYAEKHWTHPSDADKAPPGVVKGWHDAGDLTIYMPTVCQTLYWLLEAYNDFRPTDDQTNIPESGNNVPDLLDETRWGLEWVLSMQDNNKSQSGGFWGTACVGCSNKDQGYGRTTPNTVERYCKVHPPTTQNTAKAVAVLAYASVLYQPFDKDFATKCLTAAKNGWRWMQSNPNSTRDGGTNCDAYQQGNDQNQLKSARAWASASLFYATGEQQYNAAYLKDYLPTDWISSYSKNEGFANRTYLRAAGGDPNLKQQIRDQIYNHADGVRNDANNHAFQFGTFYYWGCNSNAMHRTGQFSWPAYHLDPTRTADRDAGFDNLHYIFGRNYLNICYVSGAYAWGATRYRTEGFHHWMKALNRPDSLFHFPGALAGGPNQAPDFNDKSWLNNTPPTYGYFGDTRGAKGSRISNIRDGRTPLDGRFTDNDSWSTNEIVISWNAVFLYNLYAARAAIKD